MPGSFQGLRTPEEAEHDLLVIARAEDDWNKAHVGLDYDDGETVHKTGHVRASVGADGTINVSLDGEPLFDFTRPGCRGAWLSSHDGGDYYGLSLDLGWGVVSFSDAYNGY